METGDLEVRARIQELVDRETRAWDTQDVKLLLSIFHPDFVWVWPSRYDAHDPAEWRIGMGRFDAERWRREYQELFDAWELVHNRRRTVKVEVSGQADGGFAVVDIDTLWRHRETREEMRWRGRVCKVYALVEGDWKLTQHTGALEPRADARVDANRWVEAWLRSWPTRDPEPVASLYAEDGVFVSHPFRAPLVGPAGAREYVVWATEGQKSVECAFGEPIVSGDRAAIEWWAVITAGDGSSETVAGTSVVRFDSDGHVLEDCAYWASEPGRHDPPSTFKAAATAHG